MEHVLLTDPDDPKIREVTTRMSRYACAIQWNEDLTEKAFVVETEIPIVFTCYAPDKVTSEKYAYITPKGQRSGSRIFLTPGVIALIMFLKKEGMNENTVKAAQKYFLNYFVERIAGAYPDGNDLLINNKKIMGIAIHYNPIANTANIKFMLTMKSEFIKSLTTDEDFIGRKYTGIGGVCEETDLKENAIREMAEDFINVVLNWRPDNGRK